MSEKKKAAKKTRVVKFCPNNGSVKFNGAGCRSTRNAKGWRSGKQEIPMKCQLCLHRKA